MRNATGPSSVRADLATSFLVLEQDIRNKFDVHLRLNVVYDVPCPSIPMHTGTQVKSGRSQSKSGTSVNLSNSGDLRTLFLVREQGIQYKSNAHLRLGGVPREQKILKGHLPRVMHHQVY